MTALVIVDAEIRDMAHYQEFMAGVKQSKVRDHRPRHRKIDHGVGYIWRTSIDIARADGIDRHIQKQCQRLSLPVRHALSIFGAVMSGLTCVAYLSTRVGEYSESGIEALLADARAFNSQVGVTGVLLLNDSTYFQYFEGAAESVEKVYERIRVSKSHKGIVEVLHHSIDKCIFTAWFMGFAHVPKSVMLSLEQSNWQSAISEKKDVTQSSLGLGLLLDYCERHRIFYPPRSF